MDDKKKRCPYCGEWIMASAKKCRYCGEWLDEEAHASAAASSSPKEEEKTEYLPQVITPKVEEAESEEELEDRQSPLPPANMIPQREETESEEELEEESDRGWFYCFFVDPFFKHYADFTSSTSRKQFWWAYAWYMLLSVTLVEICYLSAQGSILFFQTPMSQFVLTIFSLGLLVPSLALTVRRLRDAGLSWTWLFVSLVPIAGAIVLIILLCRKGKSKFPIVSGQPVDFVVLLVCAILFIVSCLEIKSVFSQGGGGSMDFIPADSAAVDSATTDSAAIPLEELTTYKGKTYYIERAGEADPKENPGYDNVVYISPTIRVEDSNGSRSIPLLREDRSTPESLEGWCDLLAYKIYGSHLYLIYRIWNDVGAGQQTRNTYVAYICMDTDEFVPFLMGSGGARFTGHDKVKVNWPYQTNDADFEAGKEYEDYWETYELY